MGSDNKLVQFKECRILRDHNIINEDLWVRNGKIVNPEKIFFDEKITADTVIHCKNNIIAPGFIDLQINGGYGYDFSFEDKTEEAISVVGKKLLSHGVTSYCPTVVTSSVEVYHKILSKFKRKEGGLHGATVLGTHVEGPFINPNKKGAHRASFIRSYEQVNDISVIEETYGSLENVQIITLAPEFPNSGSVIKYLTNRNIIVSLGHSTSHLSEAEEAVRHGASLITHLFNAMLPFHHRDPGLVGLLASHNIPRSIYYGIISDHVHTDPAALRIAYRVNPRGLVLVTDAISALGLYEGEHKIGPLNMEIRDQKAYIQGTDTIAGSMASMIECIQFFMSATGSPPEYALEAASLHPAEVLGIQKQKGTLNFDADADFVILNDTFDIQSTWIAGERVFSI
ncbi:unnamed protein product [Acanthoscelides obtectus]|uniref:N-acetylglucosamine-6-phosphate deacetylase n=1 Tax=Acanthoscelides obtectus TaxID=200917 RepID=A0A9P0KTG4_ACAOB|nr:unnamed protein product [Acanthoscelides obtectus]CAK1678341.1 N-acetylglucosamine-6-phosphate deacetylase [Acanthoscelides obtectus]